MKIRPISNGLITINGFEGIISLHVNQIWECQKEKDKYFIKYKFLSLRISEELFKKMFKEKENQK